MQSDKNMIFFLTPRVTAAVSPCIKQRLPITAAQSCLLRISLPKCQNEVQIFISMIMTGMKKIKGSLIIVY